MMGVAATSQPKRADRYAPPMGTGVQMTINVGRF